MIQIKNQFSSFLMLIFAGTFSFASKPTPSSLNGKIFDIQNNHHISNASLFLKELKLTAISDSTGFFSFQSVMPGIYTMIVAADSYDSTIIPNVVIKSKINDLLMISMQKTPSQILQEIVIVANRFDVKKNDQFHSVTRLSNFELNNTAATFNDINRTLQCIPGVSNQTNSDYFNDFLVRGGNPSENIFIVDNIELENPNHFGLFGTNGGYLNLVNSAFVRDLDFYTGSIPVKYSPKLSSVTDIRLREGSLVNRKYNIEFNNMMLGFATEGPLPKSIGSYLIDGQAFNMNFMKNFMNWGNVPALHNYQTKFYFPIGQNQAIVLNALGAYDIMNKDDKEMRMFIGETQRSLIYSQHGSSIQWHLFKESFRNYIVASFLYRRFGDEENFTKEYKDKYGFKKVAEFSDIRKNIQLKNSSSFFMGDYNQFDIGINLNRNLMGLNEIANCIDEERF
ncbi:MAG TPA: TonB-dependent receptor plug domain-containing protein, partial [Chitinispirillaceae bacterium]|nr:TonB-dependent receptor plug domain-containing protein [Chitinispirillaceae bacterium]